MTPGAPWPLGLAGVSLQPEETNERDSRPFSFSHQPLLLVSRHFAFCLMLCSGSVPGN